MSDTDLCEENPLLVEELDVPNLVGAIPSLAGILAKCVHEGASLGFVLPFTIEDATAYWCDLVATVTSRSRRLIVARLDDHVVGTLQLILVMPPNGGHRAEMAKLMVDPAFRRRGIAQSMLRLAESLARLEGRNLLIATTRRSGPTEHIIASLGFKLAGVVPHYVRSPHGQLTDTSFMYKDLSD